MLLRGGRLFIWIRWERFRESIGRLVFEILRACPAVSMLLLHRHGQGLTRPFARRPALNRHLVREAQTGSKVPGVLPPSQPLSIADRSTTGLSDAFRADGSRCVQPGCPAWM